MDSMRFGPEPPDLRAYMGIPYVDGGREPTRDGGLDCWGAVRWIRGHEVGHWLPAYGDDYASSEDRAATNATVLRRQPEYERVGTPGPWDIALFRIGGEECHVGLVVAPNRFVHTRKASGIEVPRFTDPAWRNRLDGFYRPFA